MDKKLSNYNERMDALIRILGKKSHKDVWSLMTDWQKSQLEHLLSVNGAQVDEAVREAQATSEADMQRIDQMIHDFINDRMDLPFKPAKIKATKPLDYDPLVREIRDYVRGKYGHGKRLQSMIDKTDAILDKLTTQSKPTKDA